MRVRKGAARQKQHKKVLKRARGFWGGRSRLYRTAKESLRRAGQHSFQGRKKRKGQQRSLWIVRINAAARQRGTTYSRLMAGLKAAAVTIDRKVLSEMAVHDPAGFDAYVELARATCS